MKYVSVCAGIEAATVAWHSLGWEPVLFSEIEPFPCAVLKHHYPNVPLVGDFTELLLNPPAADLLVGGTPCQAFSVAGKRLSLDDYRGNLSLAFADLFHAGNYRFCVWENVPGVLSTRDNAFGCLLGRLVGADGPLPADPKRGWPRAGVVAGPLAVASWRVLDAQFFGVAQRRQRVFVLVSRGAGNWAAPAALLPVGVGLSGDPAPRREARQDTPADAEGGARGGGGVTGFNWESVHHEGSSRNVAPTLKVSATSAVAFPINTQIATRHEALGEGTGFGIGDENDPAFTLQAGHSHGVFAPSEIAPALTGSGRGTERTGESRGQDPIVLSVPDSPEREVSGTLTSRMLQSLGARDVEEGALVLGQEIVGALDTECGFNKATDQTVRNGHIIAVPVVESVTGEVTHALKAEGADGSEDGTGRGVPIVVDKQTGQVTEDVSPTLKTDLAHDMGPVVAVRTAQTSANGHGISADVAHTLDQAQGQAVVSLTTEQTPKYADGIAQTLTKGSPTGGGHPQAVAGMALRPRRLTCRECERLQGFSDDYTLVPFGRPSKAKLDADFLKYQLRGNPKNLTAEECSRLASDGPRYKALGNSMAVPVMHWIGERIALVERVWALNLPVDLEALGLGEPDQMSLL